MEENPTNEPMQRAMELRPPLPTSVEDLPARRANVAIRKAGSAARLDVESAAEQRGHIVDGWYGPALGPGPKRIWLTRCVLCERMGWTVRPGSEPWRLGGPVTEEPCRD